MEESDFEGTLVLEQLAEKGLVDDFFQAIDSDNLGRVISLLKKAAVDAPTIAMVIEKIKENDN